MLSLVGSFAGRMKLAFFLRRGPVSRLAVRTPTKGRSFLADFYCSSPTCDDCLDIIKLFLTIFLNGEFILYVDCCLENFPFLIPNAAKFPSSWNFSVNWLIDLVSLGFAVVSV